MDDLDDDFVELSRESHKVVLAPITIGAIQLRSAAPLVTLSFAEDAIARINGWPRFTVAYSPKTFTFRIRGAVGGPFEAYKVQRGERYVLRAPLPPDLVVVPKIKEPAPHRYDDGTLFVIAPPVFRKPAAPALPPPAPNALRPRGVPVSVVPASRVGK